MTDYTFKDKDDEELNVHSYQSPRGQVASVYTNGDTVWVTADEAPKTAQAILDAAGVKGVVLTDLPEVTKGQLGVYEADGFTSYHQSGLSWLEKEVKALVAIWLQRKADEADKLAQQIEEAETFRANQARIDANKAEKKALEAKKAHDDLRTSPIALKALALYNRGLIGVGPYASWDAINEGYGASDELVHYYIRRAEKEEAKEKEAAEKLAARRLDIYKELGGVFFSSFEPQSPMGYAIDRIIELEDAK